MTFSIRTVLLAGFCGLLALSIAAVILTGVAGALGNTLSLMARDSSQMVEEAERRLAAEMRPIENQSRFIAGQFESGALGFDDPGTLMVALRASMGALPDLAGGLLIDLDGDGFWISGANHIDEDGDVFVGNFRDSESIVRALEMAPSMEEPVWREPIWVPEIGDTVINFHTPLRHDGRVVGLLVQGKAISDLSARLQTLQTGDGKVPFLLYDGAYVLAHPDLADGTFEGNLTAPLPALGSFPDEALAGFDALKEVRFGHYAEGLTVKVGRLELEDVLYFFSHAEVSGIAADRPITVGIYVDESRYDSLMDRLRNMILVGIAVLILSGLTALFVGKATVGPIRALAKASRQVEAGDLQHVGTLPKSRLRELENASRAFEAMVDGLKERQRIRDLFGRMVPNKIAEKMLNAPEELAPQVTEATVLFCDLAGFTRLTNELGPEKVVSLLNSFFTDMVDIVHDGDGIVTQFQGDAILAVFNVPIADPDHAAKAIATARLMRDHLHSRDYDGQHLKARIGVATGPLIAANVGAASRMNYTVHGDTVNLAARLEAMNKETGTEVLISESTVQQTTEAGLRPMGSVSVRGQERPVKIFGLQEDGA